MKQKLSRINEVSGKAGIFLGPQIWEIMRDSIFDSSSSEGASWSLAHTWSAHALAADAGDSLQYNYYVNVLTCQTEYFAEVQSP